MFTVESARHKILVVVHPGSACGSADFNLGPTAKVARESLVKELNDWEGGVIIIDGELSDELPQHLPLQMALIDALERARQAGRTAVRQEGDDPDQVEVICEIAAQIPDVGSAQFSVTGAWFHPEDGSGCVGSVLRELARMNLDATIGDSALRLAPGEDEAPQAARERSSGT